MIHAQEISFVYTKESVVYTQEIPCACTALLCMLWAREPRGQGPKEAAVGAWDRPSCLFGSQAWSLAPGLVSGPWIPWLSACTGVLCMHKSVVHPQESCACTRILWIYLHIYYTRIIIGLAPKQFLGTYNNMFCSKTAPEQRWHFPWPAFYIVERGASNLGKSFV